MAEETVEAKVISPEPSGGEQKTTPGAPAQNMVPQSVVDRITGEKHAAIREKAQVEQNLAAANATIEELRKIATGESSETTPASETPAVAPTRSAARSATPSAKPLSPEELRRLVNEQAEANAFRDRCNESVDLGKKAHNDFETVVLRDLRNLSPLVDPVSGPILPQAMVEAALETGEGHEVLYALGKDASRAERVMRLPPIKQAFEIAKLHNEMIAQRALDAAGKGSEGESNASEESETESEPPNTSRARAPIRPGADRGRAATRPAFNMNDTSKSSMDDWFKQRQADVNKKREQGVRIR